MHLMLNIEILLGAGREQYYEDLDSSPRKSQADRQDRSQPVSRIFDDQVFTRFS